MPSVSFTLPTPLAAAAGHAWTLASFFARAVDKPHFLHSEVFTAPVHSDLGPEVELSGVLHDSTPESAPSGPLLVLIHGLGGSADSGYMLDVARSALKRGIPTLRLSLRGADLRGWDFYHAGLTADLVRVLEHPRLARYERIFVLGFSLGGHVTLRLAGTADLSPRVSAVAALCPPLDLEAVATAFDAHVPRIYRTHVLRGLKTMYGRFLSHAEQQPNAAVARRIQELKLPDLPSARAIGRIRQWDDTIVARRHGYPNATEYYHAQRASTRLHETRVPSLIVTTRWDPMVLHPTSDPTLKGAMPLIGTFPWSQARVRPGVVHWELPSGGHVAWPKPSLPARSVLEHMLDWLEQPWGT